MQNKTQNKTQWIRQGTLEYNQFTSKHKMQTEAENIKTIHAFLEYVQNGTSMECIQYHIWRQHDFRPLKVVIFWQHLKWTLRKQRNALHCSEVAFGCQKKVAQMGDARSPLGAARDKLMHRISVHHHSQLAAHLIWPVSSVWYLVWSECDSVAVLQCDSVTV